MPEQNYIPHSSEKYFDKCSCQQSIREVLGGAIGNRDDSVKNYNKSEHKWKKDLKSLKKKNKILFSAAKNSGSRCELNNINNIRSKASKKCRYPSSDSSRSESDSDSSLSSYID